MAFEKEIPLDESSRVRRRAHSNDQSQQLLTKALPTIGRGGAMTPAMFDPDAYDGDGDGLVQDNTPFERPSIVKPITEAVRGLRSATGSSESWYTRTRGKTNREVAEMAFPRSREDAEMALRVNAATTGVGSVEDLDELLDRAVFDEESIQRAVEVLEKALDKNPMFREIIDSAGLPPYFVARREKGETQAGSFHPSQVAIVMMEDQIKAKPIFGRIANRLTKFAPSISGALVGTANPKKRMTWLVADDAESTFIHEYGHFIHYMAMHMHPDEGIQGSLAAMYGHHWYSAYSVLGTRERVGLPVDETIKSLVDAMYEVDQKFEDGWELPDETAFVESRYGLSRPTEFVAESFTSVVMGLGKTNEAADRIISMIVPNDVPMESRGMASSGGRRFGRSTAGSLEGRSPREIAQIVVPDTPEKAMALIAEHWKQLGTQGQQTLPRSRVDKIIQSAIKKYFGQDETLESVFAFDHGTVMKARELIESTLANNPRFLAHVQKFGMPPVLFTAPRHQSAWGKKRHGVMATSMADHIPSIMLNPEMYDEYLMGRRDPITARRGLIGKLFDATFGFRGIEGTGDRTLVSTDYESTMVHEWGHYLAKLAAYTHPDPEVRALGQFYFSEGWQSASEMKHSTGRAGDYIRALPRYMRAIKRGRKPEEGQPFVLSKYGQTSPAETFAEGLTALLSGDPRDRDLVSPALRRDIEEILGAPDADNVSEAYTPDELRPRERGMRSVTITRDSNGVREFRGTGPLSGGMNWLENATEDEIVDAIVPMNLEDAVVLVTQMICYGQRPLGSGEVRALKAYVRQMMSPSINNPTIYDFTPQTRAALQDDLRRAMRESPAFEFFVRTYGAPPVLGSLADNGQAMRELAVLGIPATGDSVHTNDGILGFTIGNIFIVVNTGSSAYKEDNPSGFIRGRTAGRGFPLTSVSFPTDASGSTVTRIDPTQGQRFVQNVGISRMDTLRHEWGHWFWFTMMGTPYMYGGSPQGGRQSPVPDLGRNRRDRAAYIAAATGRDPAEILAAGEFAKATFSPGRQLWSSDGMHFYSMLVRNGLIQMDPRTGGPVFDGSGQFVLGGPLANPAPGTSEEILASAVRMRLGILAGSFPGQTGGADLWTPDESEYLTEILEEVLGYPWGRNFPLPFIPAGYALATPQELWAETFATFVGVDRKTQEKLLSDESIAAIATIFGLPTRPRPADLPEVDTTLEIDVPWSSAPWSPSRDRGMPSRSGRQDRRVITGTVGLRTTAKSDTFASRSRINSDKNPSVRLEKGDNGVHRFTVGEQQWETPMGGDLASGFDNAYQAWAGYGDSEEIRNASALILGMQGDVPEILDRASFVHAASMLQSVSVSRDRLDDPAYRTIAYVDKDDDLLNLQIGEAIDLPLTSFSTDDVTARQNMQTGSAIQPGVRKDKKTVIMRLASGAQVAYPEKEYDRHYKRRDGSVKEGPIEAITQGRFEITGREDLGNGVVVVDVRHHSVADPGTGEVRKIDDDAPERGMASRSLIKPPSEREKTIRDKYEADRKELDDRSKEALLINQERTDYADRLEATLKEFEETGAWNGEKNNVSLNEANAPRNLTAEEAAPRKDAIMRAAKEKLESTRREALDAYKENERIKNEVQRLEERRDYAIDRINKNPDSIDIEDILSDPELLAEIERLSEEATRMPAGDRRAAWTNDDSSDYVIHFGAADLEGGVLDPAKSRGVVYGEAGYRGSDGNTRDLNKRAAQFLYGRILDRVQRGRATLDVYREILSGRVNLDKSPDWWKGRTSYAEDVLDGMNLLGRGEIEVVDGQRFLVFGEDSQVMEWARDKVPGIIASREVSIKDDESMLTPFEKAKEDDWQHISSYPASELSDAFDGYGGRYEGGDVSEYGGQGVQRPSDIVGVHVVRSKLNEDSFTAGPSGDERALVGRQRPIFSISVPRSRRQDFRRLFPGIVAKAIAEDRERQSSVDAPERGMRSTSEKTQEILDRAQRLGIPFRETESGNKPEDIARSVRIYSQSLRRSQASGELSPYPLKPETKEILQKAVSGNWTDKEIMLAVSMNENLRLGRGQRIPHNLLTAVFRELSLLRGDEEKVAQIDEYQKFLDDLPNISDEELEAIILEAAKDYGSKLSAPIIQTRNIAPVLSGRGGLTVHSIDEMKENNLRGTDAMGTRITISGRRKVEANLYGIPNPGEFYSPGDEDPEITKLRPISGHSIPTDSVEARNARLRREYGDEVVPEITFPLGDTVLSVASVEKYGESHIVLSDTVRSRTKVMDGDAISVAGNLGRRTLLNADTIDEAGVGLIPDQVGLAERLLLAYMTGGSYSSIAGPLSPHDDTVEKYSETATLGTFSPDEVVGVYAHTLSQLRRTAGKEPEGLNPNSPYNFSLIMDAARHYDELADRGIQLVVNIGNSRIERDQKFGVLEHLNPRNVELFNPTFTRPWVEKYREEFLGGLPDSVLIPDDEPDTTPYEAQIRAMIYQLENGHEGVRLPGNFWLEERSGEPGGVETLKAELDRAIQARKRRSAIPPSRLTTNGKSLDWVDIRTKDFSSNHPSMSVKSLSYTKPELRERIKRRIMAGDKGGKPGQWSARKAQMLAMEYRKAGGGYRGGLRKTQRSLKSWTRQKWRTSDGKPAIRKGGTRRYLPAEAWNRLTPAQRAATNRKKIAGSKKGSQFVPNTRAAERAGRNARN